MKIIKKLSICLFAVLIAFSMGSMSVFACTGMYVGKDVSKEGTTVIARSEDQGCGAYNKMYKVRPAEKKKGRFYEDTGEGQEGFKVPLPEETYKYTYVPDSSDAGDGEYPASCMNEYGVSVVGTVSAYPSEAYEKLDPFAEIGLREAILPGLIACQVKTAKEAVDLTAKLVDKYGSQEGNILFYADKKEAWIFEIYGGKTYCAMKMPTDKMAVFGNQYMIGTVDEKDTKNYVFSKNLFKTLDEVGAVKEDGKYNIAKTVCNNEREEVSNMRTWIGKKTFNPSDTGDYDDQHFYPLFYAPDKKVSVLDIFNTYRNRYQDTEYDMSEEKNCNRRAIGVTRSSDIHAIQIFEDMPKECNALQWLCLGNAEASVFVPSFSGITDTIDSYKVDGTPYNEKSAYWLFKRNFTLVGSDREHLGDGVKAYWNLQEEKMLKQMMKEKDNIKKEYKASREKGDKYVTSLAASVAKEQIANAKKLFNDLMLDATNNLNDSEKHKTVFDASVDLEKAAKIKGYTITKVESKKTSEKKADKKAKADKETGKDSKDKKEAAESYELTKKGSDAKLVITVGSDEAKLVNGDKSEDLLLSKEITKDDKAIYGPLSIFDSIK